MSKALWNFITRCCGVIGLASITGQYYEWKGFINQGLKLYQDNLYPVFDKLFFWVDIDLPGVVYDYLIIGLLIGVTNLKFYLTGYRRKFNTDNSLDELIYRMYEVKGTYHEYYYSKWKKFWIKFRASFMLGYISSAFSFSKHHRKYRIRSFLFTILTSTLLWPLFLIIILIKTRRKIDVSDFFKYDTNKSSYLKISREEAYKLFPNKPIYQYSLFGFTYKRIYLSNIYFKLFWEILGTSLLILLLLILVNSFFIKS